MHTVIVVVEVTATAEVMTVVLVYSPGWERGAQGEGLCARLCHLQAVKP